MTTSKLLTEKQADKRFKLGIHEFSGTIHYVEVEHWMKRGERITRVLCGAPLAHIKLHWGGYDMCGRCQRAIAKISSVYAERRYFNRWTPISQLKLPKKECPECGGTEWIRCFDCKHLVCANCAWSNNPKCEETLQ